MKRVSFLLAALLVAPIATSAAEPFRMVLKEAKVGELPKGWVAAKTGEGPGSVWKVVEDPTAPGGGKALAQTSPDGPGGLFNLCVAEDTSFTDVDINCSFKPIAGNNDRGGGPVWRYKDAKNYYVARVNPPSFNLYKVVDGKRTMLKGANAADAKVQLGTWHTIHVVEKGDQIQCYLDGKLYLEAKDDTFKDAGKVGLWSKSDAQTYFADFKVEEGEKQGVSRFSKDDLGKVPKGWTVAITGKGEPKWTVESDDSAPNKLAVLKQSGIVPGSSFPLCIKDASTLKDGFVEVKFKSVSGKGDQGAGVIWRCADKDNYYICRANAIEDNVVLYKVEMGKRTSLDIVGRKGGYGVDEKVPKQTWHTLRVEFAGNRASVMFNGKHLFDVEDQTFEKAGKVGLWTKADSVMLFDDFRCGPK